MGRVTLILVACVAAAWSLHVTVAAAQSQADLIEDGRAIAAMQCSQCHALDRDMKSPRPDAPPMRVIGRRYSFPVLADELMEGIKVGHPDMPRFEFPPRGVDSLIAYLRSIQARDHKSRRHR